MTNRRVFLGVAAAATTGLGLAAQGRSSAPGQRKRTDDPVFAEIMQQLNEAAHEADTGPRYGTWQKASGALLTLAAWTEQQDLGKDMRAVLKQRGRKALAREAAAFDFQGLLRQQGFTNPNLVIDPLSIEQAEAILATIERDEKALAKSLRKQAATLQRLERTGTAGQVGIVPVRLQEGETPEEKDARCRAYREQLAWAQAFILIFCWIEWLLCAVMGTATVLAQLVNFYGGYNC